MLVRSDVLSWAIPLLTIVGLFSAYNAFRYNEGSLSPQGCEMSWMSPSYILQSDFNSTWTPLARRYSLWLYREVGWESDAVLHGSPVLFVPGNAGSSRQVRSIASSAIRQIYDSPYVASDDYKAGKIVPLDFFAAEFNEDLSALHGPTLLSQKQYVDAAVDYILSRYSDNPSPPKQVLLLGHSMGGLVAVSVTSSNRISAVITMSSPHALPPARFDRRIEDLYSDVLHALQSPIHANGTTSPPILSLCGGATDSLIPAETCSLPAFAGSVHPYRRTAFTTNLDGAWTGVGHNEMVWCHQVRSRVARTALELAAVKTTQEKEHVLDRWFVAPSASRASQAATSPANGDSLLPSLAQQWSIIDTTTTPMLLIPSTQFTLHTNQPNTNLYLLPLRPGVRMQLVLLLHRSTLMDSAKSVVAGPARSDLSVTLYFCGSSTPSQADNATCSPMTLTGDAVDIQPLPLPDPSKPFPVPHEGSQPDDASVAVTIRDLTHATDGHTWVGVLVSGRAEEGRRGLAAVLEEVPSRKEVGMKETALEASMLAPVLGSLPVDLRRPSPLITDIRIPRMFMNALVVYKAEPHYAAGCDATKASFPLLQHISSPAEKHMHVLDPSSSTLLHTHSRGPFVAPAPHSETGMHIRIYDSPLLNKDGICTLESLVIRVAWRASLGRWALRYWSVLAVWGTGIVVANLMTSWWAWESGAPFPSVRQSYTYFLEKRIIPLSGVVFFLSLLPLPRSLLLGTSGEWILAPLTPLCLWLATGFVGLMIWAIDILMWCLALVNRIATWRRQSTDSDATAESPRRHPPPKAYKKRNITAVVVILGLVATFIPHQVAFLITWMILLWTCSGPSLTPTKTLENVPLAQFSPTPRSSPSSLPPSPIRSRSPSHSPIAKRNTPIRIPDDDIPSPTPQSLSSQSDSTNITRHILLLQTFLLPMQAPVLAVWLRTLATAGYTTPFDGDHNVFLVAFWLVFVEGAVNGVVWERSRRRSVRYIGPVLMGIGSGYAFISGIRYAFGVYEVSNIVLGWIVVSRLVKLWR